MAGRYDIRDLARAQVEAVRLARKHEALAELHASRFRALAAAVGVEDPATRGADALFTEQVPGPAGQPHTTITGAGHFLQEDAGERLGRVVVDWLHGLGALIVRR